MPVQAVAEAELELRGRNGERRRANVSPARQWAASHGRIPAHAALPHRAGAPMHSPASGGPNRTKRRIAGLAAQPRGGCPSPAASVRPAPPLPAAGPRPACPIRGWRQCGAPVGPAGGTAVCVCAAAGRAGCAASGSAQQLQATRLAPAHACAAGRGRLEQPPAASAGSVASANIMALSCGGTERSKLFPPAARPPALPSRRPAPVLQAGRAWA